MPSQLQDQLQALADPGRKHLLAGISRGIEKESLRITPEGKLSTAPHPAGLGSALTHASITTDYSEALLEFITPVSTSVADSLRMLEDVHSFVYSQINGEILWSASMPCIVTGDEDDLMPPLKTGKVLTSEQKDLVRRWIAEGAPWEGHWAYEPVTRPLVPTETLSGWGRNAIDAFIAARLVEEGLRPAPEAERRTLIRRLSFLPVEPAHGGTRATASAFSSERRRYPPSSRAAFGARSWQAPQAMTASSSLHRSA